MSYHTNIYDIDTNISVIDLKELKTSRILDKSERFYLLQLLRKNYDQDLIFIDKKRIMVLFNSESNFLDWKKNQDIPAELQKIELEFGNKEILEIFNQENLNLSQQFLGELLGTRLRKIGYFIEPKMSGAFRASNFNDVIKKDEVEAWPGFEYQFFIYDSKIKLVIDPRSRLNIALNLKDEKDQRLDVGINFTIKKGDFLKDICLINDCNEKISPYHKCRLAGVGRTVIFDDWYDEKPTELGKTNINVKDFLKIIDCPTQMLTNSINENEKTLKIVYRDWNEPRKYPLERLSRVPNLGEIIKIILPLNTKIDSTEELESIRDFMNKIQPNSFTRFNNTNKYYNSINRFFVNNLPSITVNNSQELLEDNINIIKLSKPDLKYKNKVKQSKKPSINNNGPFYEPDLSNIYYISFLNDNEKNELIQDLKNIFKSDLGGFAINFNQITTEKLMKNASGSVCLFMLKDSTQFKEFEDFQNKFVFKKQIFCEHITYSDLISKIEIEKETNKKKKDSLQRRRNSHFCNVLLGLLSKSGGIPWKLKVDRYEKEYIIIGWKVLSFHKPPEKTSRYITILTAFNFEGLFLASSIKVSKEETYSTESKKFIEQFITNLDNKYNINYLDIHRDGNFYTDKDKVIIDEIKSCCSNKNIELNLVSISDGIIRMFFIGKNNNGKTIGFRIEDGTCLKVNSNLYALSTFSLPDKDEFRTEQTIQIKIESLNEKTNEKQLLQNLFNLSRVYHGYMLKRIKHPVTVHSCRKIASLLNNYTNDIIIPFEKEFNKEFYI